MLIHRAMLALVLLVPVAVLAQGNAMGVFFSDAEFTDANTNATSGAEPLDLYIVVLDCAYASVSNYECRVSFTGPNLPTVTGSGLPAGVTGTNFGDDLNHQVIFDTPVAVSGGAVVLGTVTVQAPSPSQVQILLGPAEPSSTPGAPMVANGDDIDDFTACGLCSGTAIPGVVATINGGGITPVETRDWTRIRRLFD